MLYTSIADHYNSGGKKLWDITIKSHYLYHAAKAARWTNPRLSWTYSGEDYMQIMKRVGAASVRGTKPPLVGRKMALRWARGFTLRFLPRGQWLARARS